jgi:hypothetical protein
MSVLSLNQKEFVDELKGEWKKLWRERVDDKVRAEGIAVANYTRLFIDKGTVIHATRDFKALNFKDILEQHAIQDADRYIPPDPHVGGWGKFVKTHITNQPRSRRKTDKYALIVKEHQPPKKNGRGWLHIQ